MQNVPGADDEPAEVREARACLPPEMFARAYNAWVALGRVNDFYDMLGYYRRLHELEETFTPEARAVSRAADERLASEPPPQSNCLRRLYPHLYPSQPAAPTAPFMPVMPVTPIAPIVPVAPTSSAAVPTASVAHVAPIAPFAPIVSVAPTSSAAVPTAPVVPVAPIAPFAPVVPVAPTSSTASTAPVAPLINEGDAAANFAVRRYARHHHLTIKALLAEFRTFSARERLPPTFYNLLLYVNQGYIGRASGSSTDGSSGFASERASAAATDSPREYPGSPRPSTSSQSTPRRISSEPDEPVPGPGSKIIPIIPTKSESARQKSLTAVVAPRFQKSNDGSPPVDVSRDISVANTSSRTPNSPQVDMAMIVDPPTPPHRPHPPPPERYREPIASSSSRATDASVSGVGSPYPRYPSPASTLADLHWHVLHQRRLAANVIPRHRTVRYVNRSRSTGTPDLFKPPSPVLVTPYVRTGYYKGPVSMNRRAVQPRAESQPGNAWYYTGAPIRSDFILPPVRRPLLDVPRYPFPQPVPPRYTESTRYGCDSSLTPKHKKYKTVSTTPRRSQDTSWSSGSSGCPSTPPEHTSFGTPGRSSSAPVKKRPVVKPDRGGHRGRARVKLWQEKETSTSSDVEPATGGSDTAAGGETSQESIAEDTSASTDDRVAGEVPEERPSLLPAAPTHDTVTDKLDKLFLNKDSE